MILVIICLLTFGSSVKLGRGVILLMPLNDSQMALEQLGPHKRISVLVSVMLSFS